MTYSILDYLELLDTTREKGRYVCPACGDPNFTVSKDGAYQCWGGQCDVTEIKEAIDKLAGKTFYKGSGKRSKLEPGTLEARVITRKAAKLGAFDGPVEQPTNSAVDDKPETDKYNEFVTGVDAIYQKYKGHEREFYLEDFARMHKRSVHATKAYYRSWLNQKIGHLPVTEGLDFLAEPVPDNQWLIADLLPSGVTVLVPSDPGVGKTTMAYSVGYAVASGNKFGDRPSTQGNVLILQGDDPKARTHRILNALGYSDLPKGTWHIYRDFDFSQLEFLKEFIAENKIKLIICDSYSKLNRFSPFEEKDTGYAAPIADLSDIADQLDCSFLVIHHLNKNGTTRGTTALDANCSEIWLLTQDEEKKTRTMKHGKSRSDLTGSYAVEYDDATKRTWLAKIEAESQPATISDRIRVWFSHNVNKCFEAEELANEQFIGQSNVKAVYKALARLAEKGYLQREARTRNTQTGVREYSVFWFTKKTETSDGTFQPKSLEPSPSKDSKTVTEQSQASDLELDKIEKDYQQKTGTAQSDETINGTNCNPLQGEDSSDLEKTVPPDEIEKQLPENDPPTNKYGF